MVVEERVLDHLAGPAGLWKINIENGACGSLIEEEDDEVSERYDTLFNLGSSIMSVLIPMRMESCIVLIL